MRCNRQFDGDGSGTLIVVPLGPAEPPVFGWNGVPLNTGSVFAGAVLVDELDEADPLPALAGAAAGVLALAASPAVDVAPLPAALLVVAALCCSAAAGAGVLVAVAAGVGVLLTVGTSVELLTLCSVACTGVCSLPAAAPTMPATISAPPSSTATPAVVATRTNRGRRTLMPAT